MPRLLGALFALIFVQLCYSQQVINTPFNFDDSHMFYDLSMYNFIQGKLSTYTFTLTARPNHKVYLYLYTSLTDQAVVQVFDGDSADQTRIIPIENPKSDGLLTNPTPVVSTGRTMFVSVYANLLNIQNSEDFQAMATDYEQPTGCASMVYSINQRATLSPSLELKAATPLPCIYVLHANDPLNNPSLSQSLTFKTKSSPTFQLYKGLTISSETELDVDNRAVWAYDKHLIVIPKWNTILQYVWYYNDINVMLAMSSNENSRGTIMSQDYLPDAYPNNNEGAFTQNFTVTKSSDMSGINIVYKRLLGLGAIQVYGYIEDILAKKDVYSSGGLPSNIVYFYDKLVIEYSTANTQGSGFYALYNDPTDYSKVSSTTTSRPIQTTTKGGMISFNAFSMLVSLFSLFHIIH